jgi:cytosine/uracil/thiamine/allantoin permease
MVIRAVICAIWYGVQSSLGGNTVRCMIEAIWPSFKIWHLNSLPASGSITAPDLLSFSIFWIVSIPFLCLSIPALRWMFMAKIALMPLFYVSLFTWALTAGHGIGPLFSSQVGVRLKLELHFSPGKDVRLRIRCLFSASGNAPEGAERFLLFSGCSTNVQSLPYE